MMADGERKPSGGAEVRRESILWSDAFAIPLIMSLPCSLCECHHWFVRVPKCAWAPYRHRVCPRKKSIPLSCDIVHVKPACAGERSLLVHAHVRVYVSIDLMPDRIAIVPADSVGELRLEGFSGCFT